MLRDRYPRTPQPERSFMIRRLAVVLFALLATPVAARAAIYTESFGPRVGVSVDPGQLVFGGQLPMGEVAPKLVFSPSAEIGLGDQQTNVAFNMDFDYRLSIQGSEWAPYVGGGIGIDFASFDHSGPDGSDTNVGANFIMGATVPTKSNSKFFSEVRLGIGDLPSLKLMVGWNFPMH
jgi:hypothetical protein